MDLRIMTEPQFGATYDDQLTLARHAEACGFDGYFRSDHFLSMVPEAGGPGPTDAWTTLAGLARETSRITLGTLVSSATFREPGILAVQVAQVDQMSGGRVELGLGAGWFEAEHRATGVAFPPVGERFDRLEDTLAIVTGAWATPNGGTFSHQGHGREVEGSPGLPKPARAVPIIVGGKGPRRTPELAARYASEFNVSYLTPEEARAHADVVAERCRALGRAAPPAWSVMLAVAVGRDDAERRRRAEATGMAPDVFESRALRGSPAQVVEALGRYASAGCARVYLQLRDLTDPDHRDQLELVASDVMPQLA